MLSRNFKGRAQRRLLKLYLHNRAPKHWLGDAVRAYRIRKRIRKRTARLHTLRRNAFAGVSRLRSGLLHRRAGRA
jgi:hypothetical protein